MPRLPRLKVEGEDGWISGRYGLIMVLGPRERFYIGERLRNSGELRDGDRGTVAQFRRIARRHLRPFTGDE